MSGYQAGLRFQDDAAYFKDFLGNPMHAGGGLSTNSSLRRVMLVGAQTERDNLDRLSYRDRRHLFAAFSQVASLKVPVHPEFTLDIVNIHPEFGGRDFLKEEGPADMVVLCFVFNPSPYDAPRVPYHADPGYRDRFLSRDHNIPRIWHDSAVRTGAKMVSVLIGDQCGYGDNHITEINHRHFLQVEGSQFVQMDNFDERFSLTTMRHCDFTPGR